MSRVSSRTLRHYHHLGLLPPADTGSGGLRLYERPQLLRLQHILVLRELGMGLDAISAVLNGESDEVAALRRHHDRLLAEAERLRTLAATVAAGIHEREDGAEMAAEELFTGFRDDPYAAEARERWPEQYDEVQRRTEGLTEDDAQRIKNEGDAVNADLAAAMAAGCSTDDASVQASSPATTPGCRTSGPPVATRTPGSAGCTPTTSASPRPTTPSRPGWRPTCATPSPSTPRPTSRRGEPVQHCDRQSLSSKELWLRGIDSPRGPSVLGGQELFDEGRGQPAFVAVAAPCAVGDEQAVHLG